MPSILKKFLNPKSSDERFVIDTTILYIVEATDKIYDETIRTNASTNEGRSSAALIYFKSQLLLNWNPAQSGIRSLSIISLQRLLQLSPSETLASPLYFEIAKRAVGPGCSVELSNPKDNEQAVALIEHHKEATGPNTPLLGILTNNRDENRNYLNILACDWEITVTDTDAGQALRAKPDKEIKYYIIKFMKLLTGWNTFAIDFWANPIAQAQIWDYEARTQHVPEVTRHAEVPPHQTVSNNLNSQVKEFIKKFVILDFTALHTDNIFDSIKVDVSSNLNEGRHVEGTAVLPLLQQGYIACNSAVSRIRTEAKPDKLGFGKLASMATLCNTTEIKTANPIINDHHSNVDLLAILCRPVTAETVTITTVSRIWQVSVSIILKQSIITQLIQNSISEERVINGGLLDSPADVLTRRIQQDQLPFTIQCTQGIFAQRSYILRSPGLKTGGEHH
ncbi:MAG: hypothetical protein EZS28_005418 [Streblomastix strix]|uniref:Uncharacterized protein n=1 Tax=Streblomastix strix TaxID=222440 RepID=A0A5J4WVM2_9EUKA|nr:MAG: hypothetical protein EZS28_005418 [Streblomastix strix]